MIGRRGFLGALAGMPLAAVVQPKASVPEVTAPQTFEVAAPEVTMGRPYVEGGQVFVNITCDTRAMRRDLDRLKAEIERSIKQRTIIIRPVMR